MSLSGFNSYQLSTSAMNQISYQLSHAMTIVGYRSSGTTFTIIYKNSWGGIGDKGYMYKASPYGQSSWTVLICTTPASIKSRLYTDDSIRCLDMDRDGYYNWGIGPKAKTCPQSAKN